MPNSYLITSNLAIVMILKTSFLLDFPFPIYIVILTFGVLEIMFTNFWETRLKKIEKLELLYYIFRNRTFGGHFENEFLEIGCQIKFCLSLHFLLKSENNTKATSFLTICRITVLFLEFLFKMV